MARLCAGGVRLRDQLNEAFPGRDKRSDGWIADAAHSSRTSFHNPDRNGIVHAIDIDENFGSGVAREGRQARILTRELITYAKSGLPGSKRLLHIVYEDQVASGSYKSSWWKFRGSGYGHTHHIHLSFAGDDNDGRDWPLPSLAKTPAQRAEWAKRLAPFM